MATTYTEYVTKDGDRMDNISWLAYANPFKMGAIFDANPTVPIQDIYPAGIRLLIPIEDTTETDQIPTEQLPPWKR